MQEAAQTTPFCQTNVKLWVALLAASSLAVLGFAIWLAVERSEEMPHNRSAAVAPARVRSAAAAAPRRQRPPMQQPVQQQPMQQRPPVQAQQAAAAGVPPTDAITTASIRLINGQVMVKQPNGAMQQVALGNGMAATMQMQVAFNRAADIIRPAVVNINAVRPGQPNQPAAAAPAAAQPRFVNPFDGVPDKVFGNVAYESVGSGVIIDPRGYVVTNDHLIAGATSILITRFNRSNEHLSARIIASDATSDLALLKLNGGGPYPTATLANSDMTEVGDWVMAVGNPFGLEHTVTAGIISSRRQSLAVSGTRYDGLLQTDAPINRGSSGGPLVNLEGRVIGINTAIYAPTGVFNGTGFAIQSNRVGAFVAKVLGKLPPAPAPAVARAPMGQPRAAQMMRPPMGQPFRQVAANRPPIGIIGGDIDPALAGKIGFPGQSGVFVNGIQADSPADDADILRGDVITDVAGWPVTSVDALKHATARFGPGQVVPVTLWRNGRSKTVRLSFPRNFWAVK